MTRSRKLKQIVRTRAAKTGESYTAARKQVLDARRKRTAPPAAPRPAAPAAPRTGLGEKAVLEKTGHGFDHWFAVLDAFGAGKGHTAAARHLALDHGVPGWHAQGITVAWERARGLRAVNQAAGGFQVSVSKMIRADMDDVLAALRAPARANWLAVADPALRRALEAGFAASPRGVVKGPKRARLRYKWDGSHVELVVEPRGSGTSVVASNTKMRDAAEVAKRRAQWRVALDALKAHLVG